MTAAWKVGDWAIYDLNIVQIKEIREGGMMTVSDGSFETSGDLMSRLRPLTLRNKKTIEWFDYHYDALRAIRGSGGFNFPDINRYFCDLSRAAIDDEDSTQIYGKASDFVGRARDYLPVIDGIHLFRE